jgi:hypothetical protein
VIERLSSRVFGSACTDTRRALPFVVRCVTVPLALLAGVTGGQHVSAAAPDALATTVLPHEVPPPAPIGPRFRLGDAARPFGWSTVVADLNRDSKPDIVVADHLAGSAGGYVYRLEFTISGQAAHGITFESRYDAITISVADVDHDDDLDLVVGTPLSGEPIAVWLNDGQGRFTAGDVRQVPAIQPFQSLDATQLPFHFDVFEWSPRRADHALPAVYRATPTGSGRRFALLCRYVPRSQLPRFQTSPRAPPPALLDVLS